MFCWSVKCLKPSDYEISLFKRYLELEKEYNASLEIQSNSKIMDISQLADINNESNNSDSVDLIKEPIIHSSLIINHGFWKNIEGLGYCFVFIFISEIGDKTFLIILLIAARMKPTKLFIISSITLCLTHIISALVGNVFTNIFGEFTIRLISIIVFSIYGVYLLITSFKCEEVNIDQQISELEQGMIATLCNQDDEESDEEQNQFVKFAKEFLGSETFRAIFFIFVSEFGDRSQITTVGLASFYKFWVVVVAGVYGHIAAIIVAIAFGRMISRHLKENHLKIASGILFLLFCLYSIISYFLLDK